MKILVAGATGYLGRHLMAELLDAGHQVRALARSPRRLAQPGASGAPRVDPRRCEPYAADVTDPDSLRGAADDVDAVVTTIGVTGHGGRPWEVDYRGNLALLDEARRAGVERFVFVNVLHAESVPSELTRAKAAFADVLRRAGLRHLVVNPSGYFSDLTSYLTMARTGIALVLDGGRARVAPIHGADLAAVIRARLEDGTVGDVDVGGPETMTHREVALLAFATLRRRPRLLSVPSAVARLGLVPLRAVAPERAGIATFLLAGLTADAVAPATGTHRLREHFEESAGR